MRWRKDERLPACYNGGMALEISASMLISDLLERHPQLIPVFLRHGMACVGCSMARFETLGAAALVYELDLQGLQAQFQEAISSQENTFLEDS